VTTLGFLDAERFLHARLLDSDGRALNFAQSCAARSLVGDQVHVPKQRKTCAIH
jgi:hypothetical protein